MCATAAIGFFIALIVLMMAQEPLEAVARAAERDISRSFWVGVMWQVLATPLLLTVALALTLTIILIPAIPIAMLLWALAYAGAMTLGLFAVALVLGRAVLRKKTNFDKSALLSSLLVRAHPACIALGRSGVSGECSCCWNHRSSHRARAHVGCCDSGLGGSRSLARRHSA